jgi:hypothetical protein
MMETIQYGPFIYLPVYHVLVCPEHEAALSYPQLSRHLREGHIALPLVERNLLLQDLQPISIRSAQEVINPASVIPPISALGSPILGFGCTFPACTFKCKHLQSIQQHARSTHQWVSTRKLADGPWRKMYLQTFYKAKIQTSYFEVHSLATQLISSFPSAEPPYVPISSSARSLPSELLQQELSPYGSTGIISPPLPQQVSAVSHVTEHTPWLSRTGYQKLLATYALEDLQKGLNPVSKTSEPHLTYLISVLTFLIDRAHSHVGTGTDTRLSHANARLLNTLNPGVLNPKPFTSMQNSSTLRVYLHSWCKFFAFIWRIWQQIIPSLLPLLYTTPDQTFLLQELASLDPVQDSIPELGAAESSLPKPAMIMLKFLLSLIRQPLSESPFQSPLLMFCAVFSLKPSSLSFRTPAQFSPFLSHFIYVIQLMIWEYALVCSDQELRIGQEQQNARQPPASFLYTKLKQLCEKWVVNTSIGPMGELLNLRLYAMTIGKNSVTPADTVWSEDGEIITYQDTSLSMAKLRDFIHEQLEKATKILRTELFMGWPYPQIELAGLKDNWVMDAPYASFVTEPCNNLQQYSSWLVSKVVHVESVRRQFIDEDGLHRWNIARINQYENSLQRFLEYLLILIHFTGGQPGRGPEILGSKWANTPDLRNLFLHDGLLFLAMSYHKSQSRSHAGR